MKIFVSGSKELNILPPQARNYILQLCKEGNEIVIGDCYGVDTAVQFLLKEIEYANVTIYTASHKARVNLGDWSVISVAAGFHGYRAHYEKDQEMIRQCDFGIAIWNGYSKGTRNNIIGLTASNKTICVFYSKKTASNFAH